MKKREIKVKKGSKIDQFKDILKKYKDFNIFLRDVKISCLLGQRVQFDIDDIYPPIIIKQYNHRYIIDVGWEGEIRISSLSFIINSDLDVEKIIITYNGEMDDSWEVKLREFDNHYYGFFIELEKEV